jgi:hypothetical protein
LFLFSLFPALFPLEKPDDAGSTVRTVQFGVGAGQTFVTEVTITLLAILGGRAPRMTGATGHSGIYIGIHGLIVVSGLMIGMKMASMPATNYHFHRFRQAHLRILSFPVLLMMP